MQSDASFALATLNFHPQKSTLAGLLIFHPTEGSRLSLHEHTVDKHFFRFQSRAVTTRWAPVGKQLVFAAAALFCLQCIGLTLTAIFHHYTRNVKFIFLKFELSLLKVELIQRLMHSRRTMPVGHISYVTPGHHLRLTENAGRENGGPSKLQDMKLQDMKLMDQCAGHEIAGRENDGPI